MGSRPSWICFLLLAVGLIDAVHVFDAYRLVQYDKNLQPFGSRRKAVNLLATALRSDYAPPVLEVTPEEPFTETIEDGEGDEEIEIDDDDDDQDVKEAPPVKKPKQEKDDEEEEDEEDEELEVLDEEEEIPKQRKTERKQPIKPKRKSDDKERDLARSIVVVHVDELTIAKLTDIVDRRGASGLLIVLESDFSEIPDAQVENWKNLEKFLISRSFDLPVYFTTRDEHMDEMYSTLRSQSIVTEAVHDRYRMVVSGSEAMPMPSVTINNFQGWQHSAPHVGSESDNVPTIAIVANYDSFGAAPGLSFGADQNGSGTVAILELMRIFARLYSEFRTHGPYEILFVLTGAGRMNFAGTKRWLRTVELSVLESLEFALCLDSIGAASEDLYLHVSKNPKTPEIRSIYHSFAETASLMDVPFHIIHKKINISSPYINWQHEQFSRKRILSATLSSRKSPAPAFSASSMFDQRHMVNSESLERNIKFVAETVTKMVYGKKTKDLEVINASLGVNKHFINSWMDYIASQPRQAHEVTQNTQFTKRLEEVMTQHGSDVAKTSFVLDSQYKFYLSSTEQMSVYKVKPFMFYSLLFAAVLAYLGALHLYLSAPSNMGEFKAMFNFSKKKKGR